MRKTYVQYCLLKWHKAVYRNEILKYTVNKITNNAFILSSYLLLCIKHDFLLKNNEFFIYTCASQLFS